MSIVITLLKTYAIWIYALFAIIAIFALRSVFKARAEVRQSIFSLEKEFARNRVYRAAAIIAVLLLLSGALFYVTHLAEPEKPPLEQPTPTATLLLRATPTLMPQERTATPTATPTSARPTRQVIPTSPIATQTPVPVAPPPPLCANPAVNLTAPGENARLSGVIQVTGTAAIGNFWYYKVEIGIGHDPAQWTVIGDLHYASVSNGVLETFNASAFPAGAYAIRLVVVDKTGNFPEPCVTHVTVAP